MASLEACGCVPCTCGELFQGTLDGEPCLVSCPIDSSSIARALINGRRKVPPAVFDGVGSKVRQAIAALGTRGQEAPHIEIHTPLPVGRGYGTSTADIGAALFAVARLTRVGLDSVAASRIAVSVEPTDSTLFDGLALFDHRRGCFHKVLGRAPPLGILILDPGGFVDTQAFNAVDRRAKLRSLAADHRRAFELLQWGIRHGEPRALAEAATLSACIHQSILDNPLIEPAMDAARDAGAMGICRAHSGTVVGLLFDPRILDEERVRKAAKARLTGIDFRGATMVDGGDRSEQV